MTSRADNFNRADTTNNIGTPSDAGGAWTQHVGTWGIFSNAGYGSAVASGSVASLEASSAVVDVQVTCPVLGAGGAGPVARLADGANFLLMLCDPVGTIILYKLVAGAYTQLGSTYSGTVASGDVFKITVNGSNNIACYQNGVSRVTATDAAGASNTKHGIYGLSGINSTYDTFSITDNSAPAIVGPLAMGGHLFDQGPLVGGRLAL